MSQYISSGKNLKLLLTRVHVFVEISNMGPFWNCLKCNMSALIRDHIVRNRPLEGLQSQLSYELGNTCIVWQPVLKNVKMLPFRNELSQLLNQMHYQQFLNVNTIQRILSMWRLHDFTFTILFDTLFTLNTFSRSHPIICYANTSLSPPIYSLYYTVQLHSAID